MMTVNEALRMADKPCVRANSDIGVLAAEVRRLREENERLAGCVNKLKVERAWAIREVKRLTEENERLRKDAEFAAQQAATAPSVPDEWRESTKAMLLSLDEAIRAGNAVYVRQEDKVVNHRHCWMRFHEKRQVVEALLQSSQAAPAEWREVLTELADDLSIELDMRYQSRSHYPSEQRRYENEMQLVYRARALLQSAPKSATTGEDK